MFLMSGPAIQMGPHLSQHWQLPVFKFHFQINLPMNEFSVWCSTDNANFTSLFFYPGPVLWMTHKRSQHRQIFIGRIWSYLLHDLWWVRRDEYMPWASAVSFVLHWHLEIQVQSIGISCRVNRLLSVDLVVVLWIICGSRCKPKFLVVDWESSVSKYTVAEWGCLFRHSPLEMHKTSSNFIGGFL